MAVIKKRSAWLEGAWDLLLALHLALARAEPDAVFAIEALLRCQREFLCRSSQTQGWSSSRSFGELMQEAVGESSANVHVCFLRVFYKVKSRSAHMKSHAEQEKKAAALKQQEREAAAAVAAAAAAAAHSQAQQEEDSSESGSSSSGSSSVSSDEDGEI